MNRIETMMANAIAETETEAAAIERFSGDLLALNDAALIWEVFPEIVRSATLLRLARHVEWLRKQNSSAALYRDSENVGIISADEPKSGVAQKARIENDLSVSAPDTGNIPTIVSDAARTLAHHRNPVRDATSAGRRIERVAQKPFWDQFYTSDGKSFGILTRAALERVIKTQSPLMAEFAKRLVPLMPESNRRKDTVARNLSEKDGREAWAQAQAAVKSAAAD